MLSDKGTDSLMAARLQGALDEEGPCGCGGRYIAQVQTPHFSHATPFANKYTFTADCGMCKKGARVECSDKLIIMASRSYDLIDTIYDALSERLKESKVPDMYKVGAVVRIQYWEPVTVEMVFDSMPFTSNLEIETLPLDSDGNSAYDIRLVDSDGNRQKPEARHIDAAVKYIKKERMPPITIKPTATEIDTRHYDMPDAFYQMQLQFKDKKEPTPGPTFPLDEEDNDDHEW